MDLTEITTFTTPTCPPKSQRKLYTTQKSIQTLPNFLAHAHVGPHVFTCTLGGEILHYNTEQASSLNKPTTLGKHPSNAPIYCLTYHSFWNLLLSASVDGLIKVWDPFRKYAKSSDSSDACLQTLQAHQHAVTVLRTHGDVFISGSVDKTVKIWKLDMERLRFGLNPWFNQLGRTLDFATGWITALCASEMPLVAAQGDIIVADNSGKLHLLKSYTQLNEPFNVMGVKLVKTKQKFKKHGIIGVMMILTHNLLITSSSNCQVRISDLQGTMRFCTLQNPRLCNYIHMAWNAEREELILLDSGGTLEIYDYRMDRTLLTRYVQPDAKYITFNQGAEELLISGRYGCQLWKIARNVPCKEYSGHEAPVVGIFAHFVDANAEVPSLPTSLATTPHGSVYAASRPHSAATGLIGQNGSSSVTSYSRPGTTSPRSQYRLRSLSSASQHHHVDSDSEHSALVEDDAVSYYTESIVPTSLYDVEGNTNNKMREKIIITTGQDSKICIWSSDRFSMKCVDSQHEENGEIYCSVYLPSMKMLVTGHDTGEIAFNALHMHMREQKIYLKGHKSTVSCVQYVEFEKDKGPDECKKYVISGGFDGKIGMCNVTNYERLNRTPYYELIKQCYSCTIICIIENSMNDTFITGAADGVIKIWNKDLVLESTLTGHKQGVTALTMDGYFLFSSCEDSEIIMWDTLSGVALKSFTHHLAGVNHMRILPQTGDLISADRNGNLYVWNYSTGDIVFEYHRRDTDLTYILFDNKEKDIYVGTHDGSVLKIKMMDKEQLEGGRRVHKLDRINSVLTDKKSMGQETSEYPPSPSDTPRLEVRGIDESQAFVKNRDPVLEAKVKSRLLRNELEDDDDLDDVFK